MPDMCSLAHGQSVNMVSSVSISSTSLTSLDFGGSFPEKIPSQNHHQGTCASFYIYLFLFYYKSVCIHECMYSKYVPNATRRHRGHQFPWNWNCKWLWATMWILGIKPRSSAKATCAINHWAIGPGPQVPLLQYQRHTKMGVWIFFPH